MKKLIYLFAGLAIIACKNNEMKSMDYKASEAEESIISTETTNDSSENFEIVPEHFNITPKTFEFKGLTSQKLQELYDLLALQNQHPEFSETISSQLESYTNDNSLELKEDIETVSIKNIQLIAGSFKISDSIQEIRIRYDIVSENTIIRDSIYAEIRSEKIILDNKEVASNKISFTKQK